MVVDKKIEIKDFISKRFPLEKTKQAFNYKVKEHVAKVLIVNEKYFK